MNKYKFEHILFAIREEQKKLQKELDELNKYITIGSNALGACFDMCNHFKEEQVMLLHIYEKLNIIDKVIRNFGEYPYGKNLHNVTNGVDKEYYYRGKTICKISDVEKVNSEIKRILDTYGDVFPNAYLQCEDDNRDITISSSSIAMRNSEYLDNDSAINMFDYTSYNDSIYISKFDNILTTPNDIYKILNLIVYVDKIPECYKNIIRLYKSKPVIVEDSFEGDKIQLKIIEEPKQYVLKPVKK